MSALRKLRALKLAQTEEAAAAAPPAHSSDAAAVDDAANAQDSAPSKPANAFASLMEDDDDDDERQVETAEPEQPQPQQSDPLSAPPPSASPPSVAGKSKKSKADKASAAGSAAAAAGAGGKKSGGKKKGAAAGSATAAAAAAVAEKEDWELEAERAQAAAAAAAAVAGKEAGSSSAADDPANLWSLLRTDGRSLDAAAEIRAVFGSGMERRPGGGSADADAAVAQQFMQGRNQGGFRRGGAATLRRAKANSSAASSSSSSSSSSGAPRRMLVRQNPAWPRTDAVGLIKAQFVAPMQLPTPPSITARAGKVAAAASGMHSNIHSLADASSAAASSAPDDEAQRAAQAQSEYAAAVSRYHRQQQLVLGPGVRVYQFVHSGEFQHQQQEYLQCVASHDVQQLSYFSRQHPFHPESLLTMSDIFASQSEFATSHEFIQRCLFVHENGWLGGGAAGGAGNGSAELGHKLAAGLARMDGDAAENAPFFAALAKHAQTLGKKGTPRTAFAVCKLLLSLSPLLDPTCTLLCIDYYALRARQYQFMLDFATQMDRAVISAYGVGQHPWATQRAQSSAAGPTSASNVATMSSPAPAVAASSSAAASSLPAPRAPCVVQPGLMYSRALAAWHLENEAAAAAAGGGAADKRKAKGSASSAPAAAALPLFTGVVHPPSLPTTAAGHSQIDAEEAALLAASTSLSNTSSSYLLQQALLMWPSVLQPLLAAAGVGSALARPAWVSVFAALDGLYANSSAWSLSSASSVPASTPYLAKLELCYTERSSSLWKSDAIQAWILLNAQQLATALSASPALYSPEHMARFVAARSLLLSVPFPSSVKSLQKSAYSDHVPHLPPELLMAQNQAAFDMDGQRARVHAADLAAAGMQPIDMQQHPLRAFLQSLLPWFAVPEGGGVAQVQPPGAGGAGAEAGAEAIPANMEAALAALQQMPAERRDEVLRALMQRELGAGAEDDDEQDEEGEGEVQGRGEYDDYQFDD